METPMITSTGYTDRGFLLQKQRNYRIVHLTSDISLFFIFK